MGSLELWGPPEVAPTEARGLHLVLHIILSWVQASRTLTWGGGITLGRRSLQLWPILQGQSCVPSWPMFGDLGNECLHPEGGSGPYTPMPLLQSSQIPVSELNPL